MKERLRWRSEEDALLCAYVKQYGPREWHLISHRMNVPLNRDAKSCAERWKNYLRPGIKQGSLTEEEQHLLIHLQAKHGNKWKKIASEIPGRTAKRIGKWWEVFQERQQRELKESNSALTEPLNQRKYDRILENFAEKLVKERLNTPYLMAAPLLPPWLSNSNATSSPRQHSPSVTLTLSPSTVPSAPVNCLQGGRAPENARGLSGWQRHIVPGASSADIQTVSELVECCRELEEGHQAWLMHKKEAAWRLRRVELQLELDKECKRREKIAEIEAQVRALREQQQIVLEKIDVGYREQISGLRRDAEAKEQQLVDQWAAKHTRLTKFLQRMGCHQWPSAQMNGW